MISGFFVSYIRETVLAAADRPTPVDGAVLLVLLCFTTVFGKGTGGATAPLATRTVHTLHR
jgi:hypothetical protein